MKKLLLFILMLLLPFWVDAEELKLDWQVSYGSSIDEKINSMKALDDGGFIAVGSSWIDKNRENSQFDEDAIILRYDKNGNLLWESNYGDTNFQDEYNSVLESDDGGFVVVGTIWVKNNDSYEDKAIIVKYDKDGKMIWENFFDSSHDGIFYSDGFNSVIESDDGFVAVGYCKQTGVPVGESGVKIIQDSLIVKYDKDGKEIWHDTFGGQEYDEFLSVISLDDSLYVFGVFGYEKSNNVSLIKYDIDGNIILQKNYIDVGTKVIKSVILTKDNNFLLVGDSMNDFHNEFDNNNMYGAWIIKIDKGGNLLWQNLYPDSDEFVSVINTYDDCYVTISADGNLIKFDKDGNVLFHKIYLSPNLSRPYSFHFNSISLTQDNDYILTGYAWMDEGVLTTMYGNNAMIVKYNKDGELLFEEFYGGVRFDEFIFSFPSNNNILILGNIESNDVNGFKKNGSIVFLKYLNIVNDKNEEVIVDDNYNEDIIAGNSVNDNATDSNFLFIVFIILLVIIVILVMIIILKTIKMNKRDRKDL